MSFFNLFSGDCLKNLSKIESSSVDLILTSPPYAEKRKTEYASIPEKEYIDWFLPIGFELKRVLKPSGSFMLNLKAHCRKGERSTYVMELVISLNKQVGFKFIDDYVWYKSATPREKTFRLKNSWEPIYHFSLGKNYINHEAIKVKSSATFANKRGSAVYDSITGNIGGFHDIADQQEGWTDPDNTLYFPTALLIKDKMYKHPAKFPIELADFFVKGFSPPDNGVVLDPFAGSGIVAASALKNNRSAIAIEIEQKYCEIIKKRIDDLKISNIML